MLLVKEASAAVPFSGMTRPLVFLDAETDGAGEPDPATDRIIQLGIFVLAPDGQTSVRTRLIHPGATSFPLKRTDVHGVTDAMLDGAPSFVSIARSLHEQLDGCDIATFNGANYDVPLLWEEFFRAQIMWDVSRHNFIDVAVLWRKMEPRSLGDAMKRFCGGITEPMHDAGVDARATYHVVSGMLMAWPDAPRDVLELAKVTAPTSKIGGVELPRIDLAGVLVRNADGDAVYSHKTNRGTRLRDDPGYARWILGKDFSENTKLVIREELKRAEPQQQLL